MRLTRLYVEAELAPGLTLQLDARAAHHAGTVLRVQVGAPLMLFNGRGGEYEAIVTQAHRGLVTVELGACHAAERESPLRTTLVQAVSRAERMDFTIQKAVELGVTAIVTVLSRRSVPRFAGDRAERKVEHWQAIAIGAAEQSGRTRVPTVTPPRPLLDWLEQPPLADGIILAAGAPVALADGLPAAKSATLVIGPEGGFEAGEQHALLAAGCRAMALGPRILRTETAALVALAILQSRCGDLAATTGPIESS
ncbi:MAG: 16S rRNA (uracil(1498)-N(3))-methyltransferase [Gammaproteobacteria bacterium]|nr:16S rRNA (uracil(1498)-N(3))-methyltransferase [Gammaproteobacteria bacterium]